MTFVESFGKNRIKVYLDHDDNINHMENYIGFLTKDENKKIVIKKDIADARKKIPQTKIYMHWYAGKSQRNNVLIKFTSFSNR